MHALVVTTTVPSQDLAERIADAAITEHLAACAQIAGPITSIYRWQGKVERATEWCCAFKTSPACYAALEARIRSLHPYEVPEIIATPVTHGSPPYLTWIQEQLSTNRP